MKEKEKAIIEAAIKLYATKGFAATSIQEIVTESGISKGAFYLYFKSKDALMIAILEYYFDTIQRKVEAYQNADIPPREKFLKQLTAFFSTLMEHKEFIIMQSREQAVPLNEQVKALMFRKHYENQIFFQESLFSIYGKQVERHLWDLSLIIEGLFHSYIRLMFLDEEHFEITELVEFILRRMDSIVEGLENEQPLATKEKVEGLFEKKNFYFLKNEWDVKKIIEKMKQELNAMHDRENLKVSLEVIESEVSQESPRIAVLQGMLSNFKGNERLEDFRKEIANFYNLSLD